jgi:polyhydroxybutyrate depolymerase
VSLGFLATVEAGASTQSVDAGRGAVTVRVPDFGSGPRPLIVQLHGYNTTAAQVETLLFQLGARAEAARILHAMPEGLLDQLVPTPARYWNATDACCDFFDNNPDDVGYLLALIDEIDEELGGVDRERIYFVGYSAGGFMAYRMACEHADLVAAVVSFSGATFKDETACTPSRPVPVLEIHGTVDTVVTYNGGTFPAPAPPILYPGAVETAQTWAAYNGCDPSNHRVGAPLDGLSGIVGEETTVRHYDRGCGGPAAELWTITGGPHAPLDITNELRDRLLAWLLAAGSHLHRDSFETGDGTVWDRSDPPIPIVPP